LLRAARGRIDPAELGLSVAARRKVPGLRREDVAALAQVSLKWYTWLEQGRDLNFSEELLGRVACVLRLSSCERSYLLALTRRRDESAPDPGTVSDWLARTVQFAPVPSLAMTLRWDVVVWNELTAQVFRDYSQIPAAERNLLKIFFSDEQYKRDAQSYEQVARKLVAEFRVDFGRCAGDEAFEKLIAELHESVPRFERIWNDVELWDSPRGAIVQHPQLGQLCFDRISYVPEHHPTRRVLLFVPGEHNTARIIASLLRPFEGQHAPFNEAAIRDSYVLRMTNRH
jgi:hypothetical protein